MANVTLNPGLSILDPSLQGDLIAQQRQQAYADLLRNQAFKPTDPNQMVSGHAIKINPLQGLSQMLMAYMGKGAQDSADQSQRDLSMKQANILRGMFGGQVSDPSSTVALNTGAQPSQPDATGEMVNQGGPTVQNANRMQAAQTTGPQGGAWSLTGNPQKDMAMYLANPDAFGKAMIDRTDNRTDFTKTILSAGIDPTSPQGQQLIQANLQKQNYTAPTSLRGQAYQTPDGQIHTLPDAAQPGYMNTFDNKTGQWSTAPIQGGLQSVQDAAYAASLGKGRATPRVGYDQYNQPVFTNDATAANGGVPNAGFPASSGPVPSNGQSPTSDRVMVMQQEMQRLQSLPDGSPQKADIPAVQAELSSIQGQPNVIRPSPSLGAEQGANNAQNTMNQSYQTVKTANIPAQTVQARLSEISQRANDALTGKASQLDYLNSILAAGGLQRAENAKTAGDLIDKNAAQIALAIGAGSNGTDALRSLAQAANPNRHMTPEAIKESVNQLGASAQVQQAKASLLTPLYSKGDPNAYNAAETKFDQNADYRLFQMRNMGQQEAAAYLQKMQPQEAAQLRQKYQALKSMGAL